MWYGYGAEKGEITSVIVHCLTFILLGNSCKMVSKHPEYALSLGGEMVMEKVKSEDAEEPS